MMQPKKPAPTLDVILNAVDSIRYCYRLQVWVVDGVISDVGQAADRAGEKHEKCENCH